MIDPNGFNQMFGKALSHFVKGMILDGIYITYMKMGVSQSCGAIAANLVSTSAAQFFIRKGMESAVKEFYKAATH